MTKDTSFVQVSFTGNRSSRTKDQRTIPLRCW
uniref:Uncharacterized protein n=1 Tax=Arundo donax TaxID=35708 RepID=A0A0A9F8P9_ARUDO